VKPEPEFAACTQPVAGSHEPIVQQPVIATGAGPLQVDAASLITMDDVLTAHGSRAAHAPAELDGLTRSGWSSTEVVTFMAGRGVALAARLSGFV
jgi:hypothetical protein